MDKLAFYLDDAHRKGVELSKRDLDLCMQLEERIPDPHEREYELARIFKEQSPSQEFMSYWIPECWRYRRDTSSLDLDIWREMFRACAYTHDFKVSRLPRRPLTVFRGATESNKYGISWTLDIEQARYFATSRQDPFSTEKAQIWVCTVPPERMFARIEKMSMENELVADVKDLDVRPAEPLRWQHRLRSRLRRSPFS